MGSSPIGSTIEVLLGIEGAHLKHKLPGECECRQEHLTKNRKIYTDSGHAESRVIGKPKAFGDTKTSLTKRSRGVCGCFHLTALIWVGSESANAADCKSVLFKVVGSTPTLPTNERDSGSNPALAAVV